MHGWTVFWAGVWTLLGVGFWQADKHGFPFCRTVRWIFATDTAVGRRKFWVAYGTGALVLGLHITRGPR